MRRYSVFWLPRPWLLWMPRVAPPPVRPAMLLGGLAIVALLGGALISFGARYGRQDDV
jgi:hypothetical protein